MADISLMQTLLSVVVVVGVNEEDVITSSAAWLISLADAAIKHPVVVVLVVE